MPAPIFASSTKICDASCMAFLIGMMLEICDPMWKCRSCRQSSMSRSARRSTTVMISELVRPNFARSPAESAQRPTPFAVSFARTPMSGRRPVCSDTLRMMSSSSMRSSVTMTVLPKRCASTAVSMYL